LDSINSQAFSLRGKFMKIDIHPQYQDVSFKCSCGNVISVGSTINTKEQHIDVCSKCHPFYTGKQKLVDAGGRIHKFRKKYALKTPADSSQIDKKAE
jgi:large subunit ribosomal protein L31